MLPALEKDENSKLESRLDSLFPPLGFGFYVTVIRSLPTSFICFSITPLLSPE